MTKKLIMSYIKIVICIIMLTVAMPLLCDQVCGLNTGRYRQMSCQISNYTIEPNGGGNSSILK